MSKRINMHTTETIRKAIEEKGKRRTSDGMRRAIVDVLVAGTTWREAAIKNDVTESGILRAMRRLGLSKSTA